MRPLVRLTLTVPTNLQPILDSLTNESVGVVVRSAIRSAIAPAKMALKSIMKSDLMKSDQSTGASERAVDVKYGRSKKFKFRFYGIVGINNSHVEYTSTKPVENQVTRLRKGKQRGAGLFAVQTRFGKRNNKKMMRSKQVFSRYRNPIGMRTKGLKRVPKRYFHLINRGFNHFSGKRAIAYEFLERLKSSLGNSTQLIFADKLHNMILPTIQREINKKTKKHVQ